VERNESPASPPRLSIRTICCDPIENQRFSYRHGKPNAQTIRICLEPRILVVPIRDGFDKALPRKLRARRRRHADVQDFPPGQIDDDEAKGSGP
jgi:hypothetical protein